MEIIKVDKDTTIKIYGVEFHGIEEIRKFALSREPKEGVYVGMDEERYPCFDFEDFASENRHYTNYIFATSKLKLVIKLAFLKELKTRSNYRKLHQDTPLQLLPLIYFEGSSHHPLEIGESPDVSV